MTRSITIRDMRRFRELAGEGMCRTHAARAVGQSFSWGIYWAHRMHIDFQPMQHTVRPPADAIATLRSTMRGLEVLIELGAVVKWLRERDPEVMT